MLQCCKTISTETGCCAELREMRQFVKRLGLTGRLAQLLVERHGKHTEARLRQDPYFCLYGMPGVTFRWVP